jgi:hypothetical protein
MELGAIYDRTLMEKTTWFFRDKAALEQKHAKPLIAFIQAKFSKDQFTAEILQSGQFTAFIEKANKNEAYQKTADFRLKFVQMGDFSQKLLTVIIESLRDIFVANNIEKNPLKVSLIESAETLDQARCVCWLTASISLDDFRSLTYYRYKVQPDDQIYRFESPEKDTKGVARKGFIQVRENKIHAIIDWK